jgi:hypothetical protein
MLFQNDGPEAPESGDDNAADDWDDVEGDDVDDDEGGYDDDDDDEGWITPSNFSQKRLEMFGVEASKKPEVVKVACMTSDFAMQVSSLKPPPPPHTKKICLSLCAITAVRPLCG